jgi:hypothetical protein
MMGYSISCQCGGFQAELEATAPINRGVCYCLDCQAFAFTLRQEAAVLDDQGGTDILQTAPSRIRLLSGTAHLGCLRLTPEGLLRWYATCCDAPIGNTPASPSLPVVGLVHTVFGAQDLDSIAPSRMRVFTQGARREPRPRQHLPVSAGLKIARMVLTAHLSGAVRRSPFFAETANGKREPVVKPRVLSAAELEAVRTRVQEA